MSGNRAGAVTESQKNIMTEYLKNHSELCSSKFSESFSHKKAQQLWMQLTENLNAMPGGAKKDWKQWRRTWADLKRIAKKKASDTKKSMRQTGGGEPPDDMTPNENEILEIIKPSSTYGMENIEESIITFDFGNDLNEDLSLTDNKASTSSQKNSLYTEHEEEHMYALNEPAPAETTASVNKTTNPLRGKKVTASRRHITALKLNQNLVNTIEEKKDVMANYYDKKIKFMQFKKIYCKRKLNLMVQNNENQKKMLTVLRILLRNIKKNA